MNNNVWPRLLKRSPAEVVSLSFSSIMQAPINEYSTRFIAIDRRYIVFPLPIAINIKMIAETRPCTKSPNTICLQCPRKRNGGVKSAARKRIALNDEPIVRLSVDRWRAPGRFTRFFLHPFSSEIICATIFDYAHVASPHNILKWRWMDVRNRTTPSAAAAPTESGKSVTAVRENKK